MEMISPYTNWLQEEKVNSLGRKIKSFKAQIISKSFIQNVYNPIKNNQEILINKKTGWTKTKRNKKKIKTSPQEIEILELYDICENN